MKTNFLSLFAAFLFASATLALGATNDLSGALQKGLFEEEANHNLEAAAQAYQSVAAQFDKDRKLAATAIFRLGEVYRKQGKTNEANAQYERIMREFSDQTPLVELSRNNLPKVEVANGGGGSGGTLKAFSSQSAEDQEIARIKTMIKDSPDLINAKTISVSGGAGTPLHKAAQDGQLIVAKFLQENGADINAVSKGGYTPLSLAAQSGNRAMVEFLLRHGADNSIPIPFGTPLHVAAQNGFKAVAETLLAHGADVNSKDANGNTPLFSAVSARNLEMAKFLIANKANVNTVANEGWTPLHSAVQTGQLKLVELLLQNGANVEAKLSARNFYGKTPLHLAGIQKEMVELLLKNGANPNSTDDFGATPLHYAASGGAQEIAELLLANKADVNAKTLAGETPLFWATRNLKKPMVELLLNYGANPNIANDKNETPLGIVQNGGTTSGGNGIVLGVVRSADQLSDAREIAELLIHYGADENYERRTQIAVTRDFKQVYPIFHKGTNSWNRFSLLEVFGRAYDENANRSAFAFPNLAKVVIYRLEGKEEHEIPIDLESILKSGDCSKNIWLEWGDVIKIPEKDHKLDLGWRGFSNEDLEMLPKCLSRTVSISVKGEAKAIVLAPRLQKRGTYVANGKIINWVSPEGIHFWLKYVVSDSGLLRTSSDKTRVKVTRINPVTKKSEEQIFNLEKPDPQNQLWLRDGDQIEIPEKP